MVNLYQSNNACCQFVFQLQEEANDVVSEEENVEPEADNNVGSKVNDAPAPQQGGGAKKKKKKKKKKQKQGAKEEKDVNKEVII